MFMDDRLEQSTGPIVASYEEAATWAIDFANSHQGPDIHSLHAVSYRCAVGSVKRLLSAGHTCGLEYGLYADETFWMNGAGPIPNEPPSSRVVREIMDGGAFD